MFGRKIEGPQIAYWGARAIFDKNQEIDLVWDRQSGEGIKGRFQIWIEKRALPWLRHEVKKIGLGIESREVLVFVEGVYTLEATPNRSYGYLYIGAVQCEEDWSTSPIEGIELKEVVKCEICGEIQKTSTNPFRKVGVKQRVFCPPCYDNVYLSKPYGQWPVK
jgi:hypothetical protein